MNKQIPQNEKELFKMLDDLLADIKGQKMIWKNTHKSKRIKSEWIKSESW